MRLQKFLAQCGVASRRTAEKMILDGRVKINGVVVTQMGVLVEQTDQVLVDGMPVAPEEEKHYLLYHKPMGEVTTASDPEGRPTVLDKFRDYPVRLYPVGRLDFDSEGLLLLTNDGDLTQRMLHPSREVEKVYLAKVSNRLAVETAKRLQEGVWLGKRKTAPAKVRILKYDAFSTSVLVSIHEGRNRQVRRMFEAAHHQVVLLRRVQFGPLKLGDVQRGQWRHLTADEVRLLKEL